MCTVQKVTARLDQSNKNYISALENIDVAFLGAFFPLRCLTLLSVKAWPMFALGDTEAVADPKRVAAKCLQAVPDHSTTKEPTELNPALLHQSIRNMVKIEVVGGYLSLEKVCEVVSC